MKTDPFKLIKDDHRQVEKLFKELDGAKSAKAKENLFNQLYQDLSLHAEIEETFFYPLVEDNEETKSLTLEAYEEHSIVKTLLEEVQAEEAGSDMWAAKLKVLRENVEHHVMEEEEELLPEAEEVLTDEQMQYLADNIVNAKTAHKVDVRAAKRL